MSEYMQVDGTDVVYTVNRTTGGILVRLPGRTTATVEVLRTQGRTVTLPRILRLND